MMLVEAGLFPLSQHLLVINYGHSSVPGLTVDSNGVPSEKAEMADVSPCHHSWVKSTHYGVRLLGFDPGPTLYW